MMVPSHRLREQCTWSVGTNKDGTGNMAEGYLELYNFKIHEGRCMGSLELKSNAITTSTRKLLLEVDLRVGRPVGHSIA